MSGRALGKNKSAVRLLEILEMFSQERQTITVMEVSRSLNLPQSSSSGLLSCLRPDGCCSRE